MEQFSSDKLISLVGLLTAAISGDANAYVRALPVAGNEQTLVLSTPNGTGRLLGRQGETFRALQKVVSAAAWRTGFSFRLVISDPRRGRGMGAKGDEQRQKIVSGP
jgi:predicted RNA-binding protein YlqC (UPF0109 family)